MTAADDVRTDRPAQGRAPHTPHRTPPSIPTDRTANMTTTTRGMHGEATR